MIEVIHVEDEPVLRALMGGLLGQHDDVHLTQFPGRAGVVDHAGTIDGRFLLLTDMNLPEPEGGELVSELRRQPNGDQMTAIVMSANNAVDRVRDMAPDADDVIEKPVDVGGLSELLGRILTQARGVDA